VKTPKGKPGPKKGQPTFGKRLVALGKTPRDHFMRTADEQFAKFEREERALRRSDRDERAARLRFPLARANLPPIKSDEEQ
jgi:hypothetical protein